MERRSLVYIFILLFLKVEGQMERPARRLYEGSAGFPAAVGTQSFQRLMEE